MSNTRNITAEIRIDDLQDVQFEIFDAIMSTSPAVTKYWCINATRQAGKTYLLERAAHYLAAEKPNQIGAFIMATVDQTIKVFRSMVAWIDERLIQKYKDVNGDRYIQFTNGTVIKFYSSNSYNSIAGNSFDFMVCDEFALWNQDAWVIIKPTVSAKKNARVIITSTPRGMNNFYDVCKKGWDDSDTFYQYRTLHWKDNEFYDEREVEDARKSYPKIAFQQEYEAKFISGSGSVFEDFARLQSVNSWSKPQPDTKYYCGIDWAGSGSDSTVVSIIDENGKVCLIDIIDPELSVVNKFDRIKDIVKRYDACGYSEVNGIGDDGSKYLAQNGAKVYRLFTLNDTKNNLVNKMKISIAKDDIKLPTIKLCPRLDNEMCNYQAKRTKTGKLTYSHPDGENMHDDVIDSIMMANMARLDNLDDPIRIYECDYSQYINTENLIFQ